jgi:hypothetical protein
MRWHGRVVCGAMADNITSTVIQSWRLREKGTKLWPTVPLYVLLGHLGVEPSIIPLSFPTSGAAPHVATRDALIRVKEAGREVLGSKTVGLR